MEVSSISLFLPFVMENNLKNSFENLFVMTFITEINYALGQQSINSRASGHLFVLLWFSQYLGGRPRKAKFSQEIKLVMCGGTFFCLGFSVDHEHSVEIIDGSYSHRLTPKDENLSKFFISFHKLESVSWQKFTFLLCMPLHFENYFSLYCHNLVVSLSQVQQPFHVFLEMASDACTAYEKLLEQTHYILTVCRCCSSSLPRNSRIDNFFKCWFQVTSHSLLFFFDTEKILRKIKESSIVCEGKKHPRQRVLSLSAT